MSNVQNSLNIDSSQLTQIIETSVVRILQNLNVFPNNSGNSNNAQPQNSVHTNVQPTRLAPSPENNIRNPIPSPSHFNDTYNIRSDKVTSVIQNWNLKSDGSANGLNVEEFLYRIRSLTADNFNNDFSMIHRTPILRQILS
ncbi:hypothetical protein CVS40_9672 [Lucilia cuprina]|nr:hypothetical protein CVS40_9672 [Lucilia cuprina]